MCQEGVSVSKAPVSWICTFTAVQEATAVREAPGHVTDNASLWDLRLAVGCLLAWWFSSFSPLCSSRNVTQSADADTSVVVPLSGEAGTSDRVLELLGSRHSHVSEAGVSDSPPPAAPWAVTGKSHLTLCEYPQVFKHLWQNTPESVNSGEKVSEKE